MCVTFVKNIQYLGLTGVTTDGDNFSAVYQVWVKDVFCLPETLAATDHGHEAKCLGFLREWDEGERPGPRPYHHTAGVPA
ncbi:hypothetical protein DPMN_114629 [Dreissena polymorpha]|uniref:Uncharacterized protein n=1 Tax=Dreissena polymorpha TaxID=45954 RepID=A0A9D4QRR2_DREPO|nr:hypothetical protein DPMN_114629 [Dreissena polymorpha]